MVMSAVVLSTISYSTSEYVVGAITPCLPDWNREHCGAREPIVRHVEERPVGLLQRVARDGRSQRNRGRQSKQLLTVAPSVRGDAQQSPFLEQVGCVVQRGN